MFGVWSAFRVDGRGFTAAIGACSKAEQWEGSLDVHLGQWPGTISTSSKVSEGVGPTDFPDLVFSKKSIVTRFSVNATGPEPKTFVRPFSEPAHGPSRTAVTYAVSLITQGRIYVPPAASTKAAFFPPAFKIHGKLRI